MPAPFSSVHIPFISGIRQDLGKLAQDNPAQLRQAQNVLFTRKGHITGRPGLVSRDGQVQTAPGTALVGNLATATNGLTPAGIVATGFQATNKADIDTALLCYQGQSFYNRAGVWETAGAHWSLRQTKSVALGTSGSGVPLSTFTSLPVGQDVVFPPVEVVNLTTPAIDGIPFLNATGDIKYRATGATGFANIEMTCAAGNSVFWKDPSSATFSAVLTNGAGPSTTGVLTPGGGANSITVNGGLDVATDGTFFYVVFGSPTLGSNTATLFKMDITGTVIQVLNLVFTAGAMNGGRGLSICYDPTSNRLGIAGIVHSTGAVGTKIITLTAGVMADAGIDLTLTGTAGVTTQAEQVRCGLTHNGRMSIIFTQAPTRWDTGAISTVTTGSLYVGGRLFTAATETAHTNFIGAVNSFGVGHTWYPMFAGCVIAGKTLIGIMRGLDNGAAANQWSVLDFSLLYSSGNTAARQVVACGIAGGISFLRASSVFSDGTNLSFGVLEGSVFSGNPDTNPSTGTGNVATVKRGVFRRITLTTQGVQAAHVAGTTLLSGQLLHVFDGVKVRPHHFPEEAPYIFQGGNGFVYATNGGQLAAGSYSYQVTWETLNSRGQVLRSGASEILTVSGVLANQQVTFHVTIPQLWDSSTTNSLVVRFWGTQTNPTNNAPKYLLGEGDVRFAVTPFDFTFTNNKVPTGTEEQLYETVDTLADNRVPGADRGVAVVAERAWCADQDKLYASKLLKPNIALSWSNEDTNVITIPTALGTIQGLAAINQGLVVLCSRGAAVITGPGVDDTGTGPGWVTQIIDGVPGMGNSSPRSCATTPAGVTFQAQDGDIWLASSSGQAVPLSRPARDVAVINQATGIDVVSVTSTPNSNAMLVAHGPSGVLRVLDLEMGQWGTWIFPPIIPTNGLFIAAINGALWLQTTSPVSVFSADNFASTSDAGLGNITSLIETGVLRQEQPTAHGWGRLRRVVLNEIRKSTDTQVNVTMQVLADQNDRVLMNKTQTTNPTNTSTFPGAGDGELIFGTTVQRCAHCRVIMSITPAVFNIEGLDLWVANTGETAPSNNRS